MNNRPEFLIDSSSLKDKPNSILTPRRTTNNEISPDTQFKIVIVYDAKDKRSYEAAIEKIKNLNNEQYPIYLAAINVQKQKPFSDKEEGSDCPDYISGKEDVKTLQKYRLIPKAVNTELFPLNNVEGIFSFEFVNYEAGKVTERYVLQTIAQKLDDEEKKRRALAAAEEEEENRRTIELLQLQTEDDDNFIMNVEADNNVRIIAYDAQDRETLLKALHRIQTFKAQYAAMSDEFKRQHPEPKIYLVATNVPEDKLRSKSNPAFLRKNSEIDDSDQLKLFKERGLVDEAAQFFPQEGIEGIFAFTGNNTKAEITNSIKQKLTRSKVQRKEDIQIVESDVQVQNEQRIEAEKQAAEEQKKAEADIQNKQAEERKKEADKNFIKKTPSVITISDEDNTYKNVMIIVYDAQKDQTLVDALSRMQEIHAQYHAQSDEFKRQNPAPVFYLAAINVPKNKLQNFLSEPRFANHDTNLKDLKNYGLVDDSTNFFPDEGFEGIFAYDNTTQAQIEKDVKEKIEADKDKIAAKRKQHAEEIKQHESEDEQYVKRFASNGLFIEPDQAKLKGFYDNQTKRQLESRPVIAFIVLSLFVVCPPSLLITIPWLLLRDNERIKKVEGTASTFRNVENKLQIWQKENRKKQNNQQNGAVKSDEEAKNKIVNDNEARFAKNNIVANQKVYEFYTYANKSKLFNLFKKKHHSKISVSEAEKYDRDILSKGIKPQPSSSNGTGSSTA